MRACDRTVALTIDRHTENDTRRKAASDFTRALMENFQEQVTGIISRYIGYYLQEYNANREENWKQKDTAIYLLTSIASRGSTTQVSDKLAQLLWLSQLTS